MEVAVNNQGREKSSVSALVSVSKDVIALLRDAAILALTILLVAWPEGLNSALVRAGFEEGSLVGLKWRAKVSEQDRELVAAQTTIAELKAQNFDLEKALGDARAQLSDVTLKGRITDLQQANAQLVPAAAKVQTSLQKTISSNTSWVEKLQTPTESAATWAVVFSGDTKLDGARHERDIAAPKLGVTNAAIYHKQGWYRGVVTTPDRADANKLLATLKQRRADSYVVDMSIWCPRTKKEKDYIECVSQ